MKYYLVALFDDESQLTIESMQKRICQKYKLRNTHAIYIPLETVEDPNMEKLEKILLEILRPYKKFKVETSGTLSLEAPHKTINLKIENKGYIIRLARKINDALKINGFNVRDSAENCELFVSLANASYSMKEWSSRDYIAASEEGKRKENYKLPRVNRIGIWKSGGNKRDALVKEFVLRDF